MTWVATAPSVVVEVWKKVVVVWTSETEVEVTVSVTSAGKDVSVSVMTDVERTVLEK